MLYNRALEDEQSPESVRPSSYAQPRQLSLAAWQARQYLPHTAANRRLSEHVGFIFAGLLTGLSGLRRGVDRHAGAD